MSLLSVVGCQSVSVGEWKSCRLLPGVRTGQDDCGPSGGGWQSASDSVDGADSTYSGGLS